MKQLYCPHCGQPVYDFVKRCPHCDFDLQVYLAQPNTASITADAADAVPLEGASMEEPNGRLHQLPCPQCGQPVSDFVKHCPSCDFPVQEYRSQQAVAAMDAAPAAGVPMDDFPMEEAVERHLNLLPCPQCGQLVSDFVVYCPYCEFAVQDYLDKQAAERAAAYFSDLLPPHTIPVTGTPQKPPSHKKPTAVWLLVVAAVLVVAGVLLFPRLTSVVETKVEVPSMKKPSVTVTDYYRGDNRTFTLHSDDVHPHVAVYQGVTESPVCVYMEDGEGIYTGVGLGRPIGYLVTDNSVYMKSISTTYQYYVMDDGNKLCLVNFDITFDRPVNGLFLFDLQYNFNSIRRMGRSVSVMNGTTRVVEYVDELPEGRALEVYLTPKGFVDAGQEVLRTGERLWGGRIYYKEGGLASYSSIGSEKYVGGDTCYASCEGRYDLTQDISDPLHTMLLYCYTVESGGNAFELHHSTYYCRFLMEGMEEEVTTLPSGTSLRLPHTQLFYGSPVAKPTYINHVIGLLMVHPYAAS